MLQNQGCSAHFERDADAMTTEHNRRVVEGAAAGDLDGNGFVDVVSVSSHDIPKSIEQKHYGLDWGSPFDAGAVYTEYLEPAPGGNFIPMGRNFPDGRLVIDLNGGGNGNGSVAVRTLGAVGLVKGARVNRSGIGAVVTFTPQGMAPSTKPIMGGASYASQDALETVFGLGVAGGGTVDVLWPGGVRNRLYDVARGEHVLLPEIPCDFAAGGSGEGEYRGCVRAALDDLVAAKVLRRADTRRYLASALRAYAEAHGTADPTCRPRRRAAAAAGRDTRPARRRAPGRGHGGDASRGGARRLRTPRRPRRPLPRRAAPPARRTVPGAGGAADAVTIGRPGEAVATASPDDACRRGCVSSQAVGCPDGTAHSFKARPLPDVVSQTGPGAKRPAPFFLRSGARAAPSTAPTGRLRRNGR